MTTVPLKDVLGAAQHRLSRLNINPQDLMLVARPGVGDTYPPNVFNQQLFGRFAYPEDLWEVGCFVDELRCVILVHGTAAWEATANCGADLLRAIAARPRRERIELSVYEAWRILDDILTPFTDSDGIGHNEAPRITLPASTFVRPWATFLSTLLLVAADDIPSIERWTIENGEVKILRSGSEGCFYSVPVSTREVTNGAIAILAKAFDSESTPEVNPSLPPRSDDTRDEDGYIINPLDTAAYLPKSDILNKHCAGTLITTDKKLTRELERNRKAIRQWRPRSNRLRVHLADWYRHIHKEIPSRAPRAEYAPTPDELARLKPAIRSSRDFAGE